MGQWNHCQMPHKTRVTFLVMYVGCVSVYLLCVWAVNVKMYVNSHSKLTAAFCVSGVRRSLFYLRPQSQLPRERTSRLRFLGISRRYYRFPRTKCPAKLPLVPPQSTSSREKHETDMTFSTTLSLL